MYVNVGKLVSDVRRIVAQNPEFVYARLDAYELATCVYFEPDSGCPSCLIGHGLALQGITYGTMINGYLNESSIAAVLDQASIPYGTDTRYLHWLRKVQRYQDTGMSWGECVRQADLHSEWYSNA